MSRTWDMNHSARRELSRCRLQHCESENLGRYLCERVEHWAHAAVRESGKNTMEKLADEPILRSLTENLFLWVIFFICATAADDGCRLLLIKRSLEPMQTLTLSLKQHQSADFSNFTNIAAHKHGEFSFRFRIFFSFFFCYFLSPTSSSSAGVSVQCVGFGRRHFSMSKSRWKREKKNTKKRITFSWNFLFVSLSTTGGSAKKKNVCYLVAFSCEIFSPRSEPDSRRSIKF